SGPHRQHRRDRCAAPLARVPHGYTRLAARQLLPDRIGEAGHEDDGEGLERQELHGDGIERGSVGYEHDFPGHGRGVERAPRGVARPSIESAAMIPMRRCMSAAVIDAAPLVADCCRCPAAMTGSAASRSARRYRIAIALRNGDRKLTCPAATDYGRARAGTVKSGLRP